MKLNCLEPWLQSQRAPRSNKKENFVINYYQYQLILNYSILRTKPTYLYKKRHTCTFRIVSIYVTPYIDTFGYMPKYSSLYARIDI